MVGDLVSWSMLSYTPRHRFLLDRIQRGLVSCVIVVCVGLQVRVVMGSQPPRKGAGYWPFVDYPMYAEPHRLGDEMARYVLWGELDDSTVVRIPPEDLGLSFWRFLFGVVEAMQRGDRDRMAVYAQMYLARYGRHLTSLRLENHPWIFVEGGVVEGPVRVVRTLRCDAGGGQP